MRRRIKLAFLACFLLFSCLLTACSSDEEPKILVPVVEKDVYVYDQGNFVEDEVEEKINSLLVQLEEQTTIEFAVITIPSLNDLTIESYAVKLGNTLGIGKADEDNGILLLISKEDTRVRLEIGPGLQGILTDSISGRILDNYFVPFRDEGNYEDASMNTVQAVINCLADSEEYEITIDSLNKELKVENEEMDLGELILAIIVIIAILCFIEWFTGHLWGDGFRDGIVVMFLDAASDGSSSSGGSFGGGGFNGGGASR